MEDPIKASKSIEVGIALGLDEPERTRLLRMLQYYLGEDSSRSMADLLALIAKEDITVPEALYVGFVAHEVQVESLRIDHPQK